MPQRPIEPILLNLAMHLDDCTDDELSALADAIKAEQVRRFRLRRGPSWVDDIRQSLQQGRGETEEKR